MAISDGVKANASNFNAAFVSKTVDDSKTGKFDLTDPSSASVIDVQQNINTNKTNIATNTSDISTNTGNIATNTGNIATNTGNIGTNTTAIALNTAKVSADGSIDSHSDVDTTTSAPTDGQVLTWNNANSEWEPQDTASGSGTGQVNYCTNPSAETDTTGWTTYKDAAGTSPVDGTGGSPVLTLTRNTTANQIMRGSASFLVTQTNATNHQGEGYSYDLTIGRADTLRRISLSFIYAMEPDTLNDEFQVFVYDVTNAALIGTLTNDDNGFLKTGGMTAGNVVESSNLMTGHFDATDSLSYRLIVHCGTTNTTNTRLMTFDDVVIGPAPIAVINSPKVMSGRLTGASYLGATTQRRFSTNTIKGKSDVIDYTDDGTNGTRLTAVKDGTEVTIVYQEENNAVGSSRNIDIKLNGVTFLGVVNRYAPTLAGKLQNSWTGILDEGDYLTFQVSNTASFATSPAQTYVSYSARIEASNVISTNDIVHSTIHAKYERGSTQTITAGATTIIDFNTVIEDKFNTVTTGATWKYVVQKTAKYRMKANVLFGTGTFGAAFAADLAFHISGGTARVYTTRRHFVDINLRSLAIDESHFLLKGDEITLKVTNGDVTNTHDVFGSASYNTIEITEVPDFTAFAVLQQPYTYPEIPTPITPISGVMKLYPKSDSRFRTVNDQGLEEIISVVPNKNYLINSNFDVFQYASTSTSTGYATADRWSALHGTGAHTATITAFTLGQTDVPNNPTYYYKHDQTSVASVAYEFLTQKIENPKQFSGKTITVSFRAKASISFNLLVDPFVVMNSVAELDGTGDSFALTTSWAKYSFTETLTNFASGATSTADDYLALRFIGETLSLAVIDISQVKFEISPVATDYVPDTYEKELRNCQRYYQINPKIWAQGLNGTSTTIYCIWNFIVPMRDGGTPVLVNNTPYTEHLPLSASDTGSSSVLTYHGGSTFYTSFKIDGFTLWTSLAMGFLGENTVTISSEL